jgi:hypothetical protein
MGCGDFSCCSILMSLGCSAGWLLLCWRLRVLRAGVLGTWSTVWSCSMPSMSVSFEYVSCVGSAESTVR